MKRKIKSSCKTVVLVLMVALTLLGCDTSEIVQKESLTNSEHVEETEKVESVNSIAIDVQGMLEAAEEEASVLHKKLTEDPSLKQSDMNELSHEIYQIWDDLLNELWAVLKDTLDEKTMNNLLEEQRTWITMKEAEAKKAGEAFAGGSMAQLASNQKAAELTKKRVYELATYLGF